MKEKHLVARIKQCLAISECSPCTRHKVGALLLDPERNVVLMDGYNGGPRGGEGELCGGNFCLRDGAPKDESRYSLENEVSNKYSYGMLRPPDDFEVVLKTHLGLAKVAEIKIPPFGDRSGIRERAESKFKEVVKEYISSNPPIQTGTQYEVGCHHAEMNVITNAAAQGVSCAGAWLVINQEPCVLCSKLIHHAGIKKVICVSGTFKAGAGSYLEKHGIEVQFLSLGGLP